MVCLNSIIKIDVKYPPYGKTYVYHLQIKIYDSSNLDLTDKFLINVHWTLILFVILFLDDLLLGIARSRMSLVGSRTVLN